MTVVTTQHGRHADRERTEAPRRPTRAERRSERRAARREPGVGRFATGIGRKDRREGGGAAASAAAVAAAVEPQEVPPHRELVRRHLAYDARRIDLAGLVERHGTPLLVLDADRVAARLLELRRHLPDVEIAVPVGTLPHPAFIRAVDAFGASFGVASREELDLLAAEDLDLARCLHTQQVTSTADLEGAYRRGIRTFVVADAREVDLFTGLPADARVLVRLSFPDRGADADAGADAGHPRSAGVTPGAAPALVAHCLRADRRVAGFVLDAGVRPTGVEPWRRAIARTLKLMRDLETRLGVAFDLLAVGSGIPVVHDEPAPSLAVSAHGIREALAAAPARYRVIVDAGRFVAAPAMTLVTRVVATGTTADRRWAHLEDGASAAYSGVPAEDGGALVFAESELAYRPSADERAERAVRRLRELAHEPVTLAVPGRTGVDVIARGLRLPRLTAGDLLVSPMMGACMSAGMAEPAGTGPVPIHVLGRVGRTVSR